MSPHGIIGLAPGEDHPAAHGQPVFGQLETKGWFCDYGMLMDVPEEIHQATATKA